MKRLLVLFSLVFCLFLSSVNVFAANSSDSSSDSGNSVDSTDQNITISFKVGKPDYKVNGKTVKAEPSATVKGKTFVPVNVITDALNANLKVDLKAKTAIITYNDVEIKLTEKKAEAVIAGKKAKIDAAPYIKNSSFMVSISFLADTLGADLSITNGTATFTKEIVNPNSIKDFSSLIKKTKKNKIGDSYHKWSMLLPDDLKLYYRDFIGTANKFEAQDGSYYIFLDIYDREKDETIEDISNQIFENIKDYTLIDYTTKNEDGKEFTEFVYKDEYWTYQERVYLSATKNYYLILSTENDDSYLEDTYQDIMNSFEFSFKRDGSTEDLSDVQPSGYRKYQDTRLKWSINLLPDWKEYKEESVQNSVTFNGKENSVLSVKVYSLEKGETLDSITQNSIKEDSEYLNPERYKVLNQESIVINGAKCNKVQYQLITHDETFYGWDVFFVDKNYKYILGCEISEKDYNDSRQKKLVDGMINSFKFTELNAKKIGKLLDPDKVVINNKPRVISNDLFTLEVPSNWQKDEQTDDLVSYSYGSLKATVTVFDDIPFNDFIVESDKQFEKMSSEDFKITSKVNMTDKGTNCYKYIGLYDDNGDEMREETYILGINGKIVVVDLTINNLYYGPKNQETLDKIWQSFTLK